MGGKKKKSICRECSKAKFPAISAAKLGHETCLVTAYRVLGVFNERDSYGATPIHYSARNGQLDCLQWLAANSGISPAAAAKNGTTAAHDAAAMGHIDCLQFLLQKTKCSAQDRTNEGASVLHMACRFGHVNVTRWLLEKDLSSPSEKGDNGVTPVHLCAARNHLECLKYLTRSPKYIPNQYTVHGATPVYFAAQEGSLECLQWLVQYGKANPATFANDGMSPLHASAQAGELECLKWLVQQGGVSASQKAEDGATPMHFAAASGQIDCLQWLISNGGSLMDRDDLGGTPLHDAAEQGQTEAVSFILRCGIERDIADNEGYTPVDLAKDNNHTECMKLFYKSSKQLISLAPQLPQNRASANDDEVHREKQRKFEKALLSKVSPERREEMWTEAKKNMPILPKQKQKQWQQLSNNIKHQTADTSSNHDEHKQQDDSLNVHQLLSDLIDDHLNKERPALTPNLFKQPNKPVENKQAETDEKVITNEVVGNSNDTRGGITSDEREEEMEDGEKENLNRNPMQTKGKTKRPSENGIKNDTSDTINELTKESPYDDKRELSTDTASPSATPATIPSHSNDSDPPSAETGVQKQTKKQQNGFKGFFKRFGAKNKQNNDSIPDNTTEAKVVLRHKPNKEGAGKVFKHRTSKEEEVAIVTHNRVSGTNNQEVAVKFENRRISTRHSTLSTANDDMSSPESSAEEMERENEDSNDIFKPIPTTGFDKFGISITEEGGDTVVVMETIDDNLLLAERGSLASMDVIEEDQPNDMGQPLSIEESVLDEVMIKPSPSPKRDKRKQPLIRSAVIEEDSDDEEIGDSLAPLPNIQPIGGYSRRMVESRFKIDGREGSSPEARCKNLDSVTSNKISSEQLPSSLLDQKNGKPGGIRSFALLKEKYESDKNTEYSRSTYTSTSVTYRPQSLPKSMVYSPLMVTTTATISPRESLSSVKEEDVIEEDEVTNNNTEDPNRVSLTPSQEAAFDNLEKLKNSLDETTKQPTDNKNENNDDNNDQHKEAMRTSPAVEELFDMIKGLDEMMKNKNQETSSEEYSLSSSEVPSLVSTPRQAVKSDHSAKQVQANHIQVNVEIDGHGIIKIPVDKGSLVISLLFKAAESVGLCLSNNYGLFEVHNQLKIERLLEDHECIGDIVSKWPSNKKHKPHFYLHTFHEKYALWESNPLPKGYIGQFLKHGKIPNISSPLHYSKGVRSGSKMKWTKATHCLGSLGVYLISDSIDSQNGKGSMDLVCGTDQMLYFPTQTGGESTSKTLPTKHCFIMKPNSSWKEKDLKLFCCEDYPSFNQWISAIRLVKYGLQLKCNYVAMKKRLALPAHTK